MHANQQKGQDRGNFHRWMTIAHTSRVERSSLAMPGEGA